MSGPQTGLAFHGGLWEPISRDDVEYFFHMNSEAGEGPYSWMNSVAIGCIASVNRELIVDCWRLKDFPGIKAEEVVVTHMWRVHCILTARHDNEQKPARRMR
jgi:hypothetical protein